MTPAQLLSLAVVAWLPGAVIFRLPAGGRDTRAGIDAEERVFWSVILSLCVSLSVVLALAAAHRYTFARLLIADGVIALALAALSRFRLRLGPAARRPGPWSLLPVALVLLGLWRFFPASEYVMGGKDPGVYINEGIQIAQRGTLVYDDPVVAAVPPGARDLFFPSHQRTDYYSVRFMGFWIQNPESGAVVGQFPHLFPASIAIGYGIDGLSGARKTSGVWAILGLLAVYFAARRIVGNTAAGAAAALLALHVIQVWFARYPNAEVVMQALLFAAMLASARAHADDDRFFGPVAGGLLGLLLFLRFDAVLGIAAVGAAIVLSVLRGGRLQWPFVAVLAAAAGLAVPYFAGPLRGYADLPIVWLTHLRWWMYALLAAAAALAGVALAAGARWPAARRAVAFAPVVLGAALAAGAVYALNYRHPAGKLAEHDAYALRTFTYLYATLPAIVAALIGFVTTARRTFWRAPEVFVSVALFACFFFYKIRIVPEHFWMTRRFLPVILPGVLIFACAAATYGLRRTGVRRGLSAAIGGAFLVLLGSHYVRVARPVTEHVEYAGIIPQLERLAGRIGDTDLLLVESRDSGSDVHVLGLPLAYIYARNVLLLSSARPEARSFVPFLEWARSRYARVLFPGRRRHRAAVAALGRDRGGQRALPGARIRIHRQCLSPLRPAQGVRLRPLRAGAGAAGPGPVRPRRRHPRRPARRALPRQGGGRQPDDAMDAAAVVRVGAGLPGGRTRGGHRDERRGAAAGGAAGRGDRAPERPGARVRPGDGRLPAVYVRHSCGRRGGGRRRRGAGAARAGDRGVESAAGARLARQPRPRGHGRSRAGKIAARPSRCSNTSRSTTGATGGWSASRTWRCGWRRPPYGSGAARRRGRRSASCCSGSSGSAIS